MLVKYFIRNISVKSCFEFEQAFLGGNVILSYFILALPNILLAKLNHCAILVGVIMRNISVKLF